MGSGQSTRIDACTRGRLRPRLVAVISMIREFDAHSELCGVVPPHRALNGLARESEWISKCEGPDTPATGQLYPYQRTKFVRFVTDACQEPTCVIFLFDVGSLLD